MRLLLVPIGLVLGCRPTGSDPPSGASGKDGATVTRADLEIGLEEDIYDTSITRLVAHPEIYDGKRVRVVGVGNVGFEAMGLYQNKEHWQYSVTSEALAIEIDYARAGLNETAATGLNGRYVYVEGTFSLMDCGHMGLYAGGIQGVDRYELIGPEHAQQGGAGQPATSPESSSEGGAKPKPDSEGASR